MKNLSLGLICFLNLFFLGGQGKAQPLCRSLFGEKPRNAVITSAPLHASEINYVLSGKKNAPFIILIHGLGGSLNTWAQTVAVLEKDYQVLRYDQRGHGKTSLIGEDYSTTLMAQDLKVLVDHLGIKKAHLVGHSLGARTAMRFLDLFPEFVTSAVLEDMEVIGRQDGSPEKVAKHLLYGRALQKLKSEYKNAKELVEVLLPTFDGDREKTMRYIQRIAYISKKTGKVYLDRPEVFTFFGFQANVDDFAATLKQSKQPLIFLRADPELSPFFTDAGVKHIKENGINVDIKNFPEVNHSIHSTAFDQFIKTVSDFLAKN